jgi:transcriptional regulator of acetoin/glycerol metabolism
MTERATIWENRRIEDTRYCLNLLKSCHWDVSAAAKLAQMNRGSFYRLIERLGIKTPVTDWRDAHTAQGTDWRKHEATL